LVHSSKRKQKVVVLRELHRAIIYTTEMSKQVKKSHVRMQFTVYLEQGAGLTHPLRYLCWLETSQTVKTKCVCALRR
jgi:hypothetical protein